MDAILILIYTCILNYIETSFCTYFVNFVQLQFGLY